MKNILKKIKENSYYIIITLICIALYYIHLPYYVLTPGGTINLNKRVEVSTNNKIDGSMNLLYVNEYEATIPTYLMSFIFKNWDLEKIKDQQINNESVEEIKNRNDIMLNNSIQNAIFVAYNHAHKTINIKDSTNYVIATTNDNNFKVGDIVLELDNQKINNINEIKKIIAEKEIGDKVKFKIIRNNKEIEIENEVKEEDGNKIVGVVVLTNYDYEIDPKIKFKFKNTESGSSGGLMLTLTIYDLISDENLVKGRNIAGTGTIDIDGTVGEIDGIKYKIIGAVKNKMDLILVPESNYKEALKVKKEMNYDIKIVSIKTFEDALNYLRNN